MFHWYLLIAIVAIIAAGLGFGGHPLGSAYINLMLAILGIVLAIVNVMAGRQARKG